MDENETIKGGVERSHVEDEEQPPGEDGIVAKLTKHWRGTSRNSSEIIKAVWITT